MRLVLAILLLGAAAAFALEWAVRRAGPEPAAALRVAPTPFGDVAWAETGSGPAVLVIHGAGGGADQGLILARAFLGDCVRAIAPSRFGYPGSPLPPDATPAVQADALAALMDALGLDEAGVLGMSGGVPPALQLAIRHPDRVRGLVLLSSAPFGGMPDPAGGRAVPAGAFDMAFALEAPFAALARWRPDVLQRLFDARPELMAEAGADDRRLVADLIAAFRPVRARRAGLANEGAALGGDYALEGLSVPTLVVHARDDGINPFDVGAATAARIPGATLLPLDRGGHLLLGHAAAVRRAGAPFLFLCRKDMPCRPCA